MRRKEATPLIFIVLLAVGALATTSWQGTTPQLGLDLQGGFSVVLTAKGDPPSESIDKAKEIIRQRIDGLGVAEPDVTRQGDNVVVQLPGVKDRSKAQAIVGQTAKLEFRPVLEAPATGYRYDPDLAKRGENPCTSEPAPGTTTTTAAPGGTTTTTAPGATTTTAPTAATPTTVGGGDETGAPAFGPAAEGESAGGLPVQAEPSTTTPATTTPATTVPATTVPATTTPGATTPATTVPGATPTGDDTLVAPLRNDDGTQTTCLAMGPVGFEGSALSSAKAELNPQDGSWQVNVKVKGASKAEANTAFNACYAGGADCPTKQIAIVLDDVVQSAPTVQDTNLADNTDGFVINGNFTQSGAKDLALVLRYGALPVEFVRSAEQQVSATLGKESLRAGLLAGAIGFGLVALYMLLYYRGLGLVVIAGLAVWGSLMWATVCWLSATQGLALSLAGVTGIIVSVGTTVDSYVVYFERLKDDVQSGKTMRSSTDRGFQRAFRTILTADVSSFIGAFLLYWLTVGPVRGFAFFLGLSVILDIVVAYMFTRPLVSILGRNKFFTESRIFGVSAGLGKTEPAVTGGAR